MRTITPSQSLPEELRAGLQQASHVAVLTGAGVSAESGIPTFRDAQTGLWASHDPMALASPEGFASNPKLVWDWYQWRRQLIADSQPNDGHRALAQLPEHYDRFTLITQNVDGFHQLAGSQEVLELHGNIQRSICSITRKPIDLAWLDDHKNNHPPPSPHHPDALARPDVVWFGEALDEQILDQAFAAAGRCELMIVAGTAGVVYPAAGLPRIAAEHGATLVGINPEVTGISRLADWHLAGASAFWLPVLLEAVGGGSLMR
jgi:NAD-dependent deacetylase